MDPKVTFIVPCYNLAHVLAECIESILMQAYSDYEVIIMDDCSPDNTPAVANSFNDPRVIPVRNEKNLKHLANYNKGVELARGEYVWLISADDRLRKPYVLGRYVELLDEHPEVGYVFCPAISLENGSETELCAYSFHGERDTIFNGKLFLGKLLEFNSVVAASALARKECYEKISYFPLDMPYAGDWYLWCLFALNYDVAYFAEPMVNYRQHSRSMTNILKKEDIDIIFYDDVSVLTRIRDNAIHKNLKEVVYKCNETLLNRYWQRLKVHGFDQIDDFINEFIEISMRCRSSRFECQELVVRFYSNLADYYYDEGDFLKAKKYYKNALNIDWRLQKVWLKYILLAFGDIGTATRSLISTIKYRFRDV